MNHRIIITDDHPLFRAALATTLEQHLGSSELFEASSFTELSRLLAADVFYDLVLLDLDIPGAQGFSALLNLRSQYPEIPVVVVSAKDDPAVIHKVIEYGANGFIPKSVAQKTLIAAINSVLEGDIWTPNDLPTTALDEGWIQAETTNRQLLEKLTTLTPQQFRVLTMLRDGLRNKQIAWELNVSEACIKLHVTAIFRKLGVNNRTQAVIILQQLELERFGLET